MTGPECYLEAQRLAAESYHEDRYEQPEVLLARAQVFATLALAAATALGREGEGRTQPSKDKAAWFDVAAECRKAASA